MQISELEKQYCQEGVVQWIGIRAERKVPVLEVPSVELKMGQGIVGDHFKGRINSKRQVSIIQQEHLSVIQQLLDTEEISPDILRRNLVVSGINLLSLKRKQFLLGTAKLEMTEQCHPCSRMELALGKGGFNAMRGHGGILARVVEDGIVNLGDSLIPILG